MNYERGICLAGVGRLANLWEDTLGDQVLHVPLGRGFGLPGPENPTGVSLIGGDLRGDKALQVVLVLVAQTRHGAGVLAVAGTDFRRPFERTVVPCALAVAVQPLGAIGLRACPLAHDGPFIGARQRRGHPAGSRVVVGGRHADLFLIEDLVQVGVQHDVLVLRPPVHEPVPVRVDVLEGVVDADRRVAGVVVDRLPTGFVERLDSIKVQRTAERLVQ